MCLNFKKFFNVFLINKHMLIVILKLKLMVKSMEITEITYNVRMLY